MSWITSPLGPGTPRHGRNTAFCTRCDWTADLFELDRDNCCPRHGERACRFLLDGETLEEGRRNP